MSDVASSLAASGPPVRAREDQARTERPFWRDMLAPYEQPRLGRSVVDLLTSVVPYLALCVAMYLALDVSYLLVLALAVPASGFLLRTFIVFHDCTHGSFMPSKKANAWLGRALGLLLFNPYGAWKHSHQMHHASAGDLDRRGDGDVPTLTVAEYRAKGRWGRLGYRLFRNPLVMLGLGPFWSMIIKPRLVSGGMRPRVRNSIILTNVALVLLVTGLCLLVGWTEYLMLQLPTVALAGAAGVWLFYVQHQFEDVYWESSGGWSYADAALRGSSYLKLPRVLQFFTGNIGLHHVHHLSARVPNYNLQRAHDDNPVFHSVPVLSARDGLRAVRLKLYDEELGQLVTWAQVRAGAGTATP